MRKIDELREFSMRNPVFTTGDAKRIMGERYADLALSKMVKKGEIGRITKGFYSIHDDPSLIVYCLRPAYIGLQDAMSYHNLWEQETSTVVLTTRKVRSGIRRVFGNNVVVRRISPKYFFGFDFKEIDGIVLPMSDLEKTFIDLFYFKEMRKEHLRLFKGRIDKQVVLKYLSRYDERFQERIMKVLTTVRRGRG